ncbi:MAG: hypothetical protein OXG98_04430, partial [Gemmatimonadetes bacterium]|nr:hypothetical protein [Gemmatimonadota bacterium]
GTTGSIPAQELTVGGDPAGIDVSGYFTLPAGFTPMYAASSSDTNIYTASMTEDTLTITPKTAGTDTVSVTVSKPDCDPVKQSFTVTVKATMNESGLYPWSVSGENVYRLTGNVGIGVDNPDQKLVVDGKIEAEEYRLTMIPADYVFEADYDLMPLADVERYIQRHGHLPGVASGPEMAANGIGISRMQTTLLEKIEELSLYIIAQHEQLRVQGDRIVSQQQKLEVRKKQASELEQRLRRLEE